MCRINKHQTCQALSVVGREQARAQAANRGCDENHRRG
jgi:hypothetical protein